MEEIGELDSHVLSQRAVSSAVTLVGRKLALRGFSYLATIILARILTPEIFGVFAIVSFIVTFFSFFSDVGLGAALIQKKEKLTKAELSTAFFTQETLVLVLCIIMVLTAVPIARHYNLGESGIWLIRLASISLLLTSLKTIPSILLERVLKYNRLIVVEFVEVVSFQLIAVALAMSGFGVWSFIIALVARSFLGFVTLYVLSPWFPSLTFDVSSIKSLISFGIPYQSNYFIALFKDSLTPVFVGLISGATAVGYLNWAFTFSKIPIEFMSDFFRITFPAYSRIQHDKVLVKKSIEKTLFVTNAIIFPGVFLLMALAFPIVHLVFTDKWLPALPAFYIHSLGVLVVGISITFSNTFWALGKVKIASTLMIVYAIINWVVSVPLVLKLGFIGAMIGSAVVLYVSLPLSVYFMNKIVKVDILGNSLQPFFAALLSGGVTYLVASRWATNIPLLFAIAIFGGVLYLILLYLFGPNKLKGEVFWVWQRIHKDQRVA